MSNAASLEMKNVHAATHVNWCGFLPGRLTNPAACSEAGLPSFISTFALPETIISCSLTLCQCQGTTHGAVDLARITKALLDGSPLCAEPFRQVGSPGKFMNLLAPAGACAGFSSARANRRAGPTNIANSRQQLQKRMSHPPGVD